jgi:hypothetical protein
MDIQTLTVLVEQSRLLSQAERQYWQKNLPAMDAGQRQKLATILSEAESLAWDESMQEYLSIATKATATFTV